MSYLSRIVAGGIGLATALSIGAIMAPGAQAAPGDAFDPAQPIIFIGQGDPTQLSTANADAGGNYTFGNEGAAAAMKYNAVSYDTNDNFLYAFTNEDSGAIPAGSLIKIGQEGTVTRVGTNTWNPSSPTDLGFNLGAYNPADGFLYASDYLDDTLYVIDPVTGDQVRTVTMTATMHAANDVSDWAFSGGYLWGVGNGNNITRIDVTSGQVDTFAMPGIDSGFAGAAWTYLDDSLGFSHNTSGEIDRITVTNPSAATPTFTLVKKSTGPSSANNDAAMAPGLPADLGVTKTAALKADGSVTYTIKETNHGAGWSTGSTLSDNVPAAVTGVTATSSSATCSVVSQTVTCVVGQLKPGESVTVTVTGTVTGTATVTNTVSVVGNEPDPNPANNRANASVKLHPSLKVKKSATPTRVSRKGQVVHYRFKVTNNGNVVINKVRIVEGSFSGTGHLSRPKCPKATLRPGQSEVCTAKYKVTKKDAKKKRIRNTARAAGVDPSGRAVQSKPSKAVVHVVHLPKAPNTGARLF